MIDRIRNERLNETCERCMHSSGLPILLFPKCSATTYAMLVVRYGAQDTAFELDGKLYKTPNGVAHFLEHKLFARPDGRDANELFSALGADANAWTDYDKTAYLFSTTEPAADALRTLIEFVSEPYFTRENVAREKGIIREEIAMGEDDPWQKLHELSMRAMYAHHPVRRKICGTAASIDRITEKTLTLCYEAFYRPSNMYLIVCGDMCMDEILSAVDAPLNEWVGRTEGKPTVVRHSLPERACVVHRQVQKKGAVAQPLFRISWKDTAFPADAQARLMRETAMNLLSELLFCRAGRFFGDLFENGIITPSYFYGYSTLGGHDPIAYHAIEGEADDPERVFAAYCEFLDSVKREGLSREDFERIRRVMYAGFVAQFDFPDDIADLMCEAQGEERGVFDALTALEQLTFKQVRELLEHSFDLKTTVFSTLVPQNKHKEEPSI